VRTWLKRASLKDPEGNLVRCLIPADEVAEEEMLKLPERKVLRADIVVPRNPGLHRKAFVLLHKLWPHTNYPTIERLRSAMTIGAGFVEDVVDPYTGQVLWVPKSWAFDAMDDVEFQELYSRLVDVALRIVPGSSRDDWEEAEQEIARM
jgi:hypothetical protein